MPELNFDFFLFIVTDTCSTHSIARDLGPSLPWTNFFPDNCRLQYVL